MYPSSRLAELCREYLHAQSPDPAHPIDVRIVRYSIHPPEALNPTQLPTTTNNSTTVTAASRPSIDLHVIFSPVEHDALAKTFWQHTGTGISSRLAEYCLALLSLSDSSASTPSVTGSSTPASAQPSSPISSKPRHRHYSSLQKGITSVNAASPSPATVRSPSNATKTADEEEEIDGSSPDWSRYVEERYARNLPVSEAPMAKRQLRRRIAGELTKQPSGLDATATQSSGVVTENDVYLLPSGMAAIWYAHRTILSSFPPSKSVCFG